MCHRSGEGEYHYRKVQIIKGQGRNLVPNLSFTIWYGLTIHIIRFSNYKQNFQNCLPQPKFQRITQIPRNSLAQSANFAKFAHFVNLFYIMFQAPASTGNAQKFQRIMQILRSSPTQSANYAKFAPFANITPYVSDA